MKVLYVVGACLTKNTSANMSHNAYIQGLIENGCEVDIVMAKDSWGEDDKALPRWQQATYYEYESLSFSDKLRRRAVNTIFKNPQKNDGVKISGVTEQIATSDGEKKRTLRDIVKRLYYTLFPVDPIYPLEKEWLKKASHFTEEKQYDIVISNSSPAASHKLVVILRDDKKISYNRWIQIWEDPWYADLYGGHSEAIKEEELFLLQQATEIYYVSPLTLEYQKKYYPDCADKMCVIPLPFLKVENKSENETVEKMSFGYFGDYFSATRNLKPFYDALCALGAKGFIYGDSDLHLAETDNIEISGRVTLDKLAVVQERTGVLVHLCNLHGGQIPGKIYHYSATDKPILFILDGTEEEKQVIKRFFEQFNRYCFCDNNKDSIEQAMKKLIDNYEEFCGFSVNEFAPYNVVMEFLKGI